MKNSALKAVRVALLLVAILAIVCAVTVTGGGFLDLSNIARAVFVAVAVVCGILVVVVWNGSKTKD